MRVLYARIRRWLRYLLKLLIDATFMIGQHSPQRGNRLARRADTPLARSRAKPRWVRHEILPLAALDAHAACRRLADIFNRRHAVDGMTVGKSFVATLRRRQACDRPATASRTAATTLCARPSEPRLGRGRYRQDGRGGTAPFSAWHCRPWHTALPGLDRTWLRQGVSDDDLHQIRQHLQQERALGDAQFQAMIESALGRPAMVRPRGRPPRPVE